LRLAVPLVVSNVFFTIQISIDRLFLSWYDGTSTGAAFGAAMVYYGPFVLLASTAGFSATFVAQYLGAGQREYIRPLVRQSIWFSVLGGSAFLLFAPWSLVPFTLFGHDASIARLEAEYFFCLCFCALPMTVNSALAGAFASLNRPRLVVAVNALGCTVNVVLDYVLIFGLGDIPAQGIAGAGWATVIASYAAMALAWLLWVQLSRYENLPAGDDLAIDGHLMGRFLAFGVPSGLQAMCDVMAWTIFTLFVGRLGDAALAATSIVMVINALFYVPMLGLAQAVCVQVGQHLGAERPDHAARSAWLGFAVAGSIMTVAGVIAACSPGVVLAAFRSGEEAAVWEQTAALVPGLLWFVAVYSFFDSMNLTFALALRGAGDTVFVSIATLACGIGLLVLPAWYVVAHDYGIDAAWWCATTYIAGLAFVFLARFVWGPWRTMRVIEPVVAAAKEPVPVDAVVSPIE
jgi:MATE family multidrug resistance protein